MPTGQKANLPRDELEDLYITQKWAKRSIATHYGVSIHTIYRYLKEYGIKRKERVPNIKDIAGQRFHRLVAVKYVRNDRHGKAIWLCKCDCGKERDINASALKAGLTKSCGCYRHDRASTGYEEISGSFWRKLIKSAFMRNYEFSITIQEAWEKFEQQHRICALTGVPILMHRNNDKSRLQTASMDRIDPTLGYTNENVQWVHKRINRVKSVLTDDELIFWAHKIVENFNGQVKDFDTTKISWDT